MPDVIIRLIRSLAEETQSPHAASPAQTRLEHDRAGYRNDLSLSCPPPKDRQQSHIGHWLGQPRHIQLKAGLQPEEGRWA